MRKIKVLMIIVLLVVLCCGCEDRNNNIKKTECNAMVDNFGTFEWISPDGVHYWVVYGHYRYGIAPRYDNNGELVIDKESN